MVHIKYHFLSLALCLATSLGVQNCLAMTAEVTHSEQSWLSFFWDFLDQGAKESRARVLGIPLKKGTSSSDKREKTNKGEKADKQSSGQDKVSQ
jgi:hypothetical protein